MQESPVQFLGQEDPRRRDRLPIPVFMGFPGDSDGKESSCNAGGLGLIPGLGRSPGGGHGNPLQYSCLEKPHGQRSLAGCSPQGRRESDTPERLSTAQFEQISLGRTGNKQEELKSATRFFLAFVKSPLSRFLAPCYSLCPRSQQWGTNGYKRSITILRHVLTKK